MAFQHARDVLSENQEAIVVFTHGRQLSFDSLGNGYTGNWVIDPEMAEEVDKVIIYLRMEDTKNHVFLGNFAGTRLSKEAGRHVIRFTRLKEVGTTPSNWLEFAGGGQNPVSYVIRKF